MSLFIFKKNIKSFFTSIILVIGVISCTANDSNKTEKLPNQNVNSKAEQKSGSHVLNLAIWGNYLPDTLKKKFEDQTGIKIVIANYSSNEELLAKVQSGGSLYDVAVPSDYMVEIMSKMNLLETIDAAKIPNKSNISDNLLNPVYDPGNKYSVPYAWSTSGIAINTELCKKPIHTWKEFLTEESIKGKISVLDDGREAVAIGLKINGNSVNSKNEKELEKAKDILIKSKSNVKMFSSDTIQALINKEIALAHSYSTDALQAMIENPSIQYIIPEEGSTKAIDNLVILKGSKNLEAAYSFLNFMLDVESNVEFVKKIRGGPILKSTRNLLPDDLKNNPTLFPEEKIQKRLERIQDLGDFTAKYDKLWTEIKTK